MLAPPIKGSQTPDQTEQQDQPEPRVIPRSEHSISRKNIDREALKVLHRLRDAGHIAYLVGGGVRDLYLGKTPKDFDISTDARPGQLRKLFRNSRLIGRRFRLVQVFFHGNKIIEVSTFRRPSEYEINSAEANGEVEVLAANNTFGTPAEDAFRRDLTINSLFYEIENFSIIDYAGGVEDLDNKIIRIIGDPDRRLTRDPARIMRVIRHAARNNFKVEENTWKAIIKHLDKLHLCPISRIRDELFKDLHGNCCRPWAQLAIDCGLLFELLPFYKNILTDPGARDSLLAILGVVDRLRLQGHQIPDHLLLSLLLFPWAQAEMGLLSVNLKGNQAYKFSRALRARLDEILEHLTIKRSLKEAMTLLLANLPHFERHNTEQKGRNQGRWPKWLTKKSYFNDCKNLHRILVEARGGSPVDPQAMAGLADSPLARTAARRPTRKKQSHGGKRGPAHSEKGRGGIFGFKKS